MIRKALISAAAACALLASPAGAQSAAPKSATPQQNLDCVVWASYRAGIAPIDEMRNAFILATAWFIGLYEGQTGKLIDEDMVARGIAMTEAQINAAESACIARFGNFGDRLALVGQKLSAAGK